MTGTELDAVLALLGKVSSFGFGPLVGLILVGSFYEVWVWGKTYRRDMAAMQARLVDKEKECDQWKSAFLRSMGHTDKAMDLAKDKLVNQ